jgi:hypothetical protein
LEFCFKTSFHQTFLSFSVRRKKEKKEKKEKKKRLLYDELAVFLRADYIYEEPKLIKRVSIET